MVIICRQCDVLPLDFCQVLLQPPWRILLTWPKRALPSPAATRMRFCDMSNLNQWWLHRSQTPSGVTRSIGEQVAAQALEVQDKSQGYNIGLRHRGALVKLRYKSMILEWDVADRLTDCIAQCWKPRWTKLSFLSRFSWRQRERLTNSRFLFHL